MEETEAAPLRAYLAISPASMLSGRTRAMEGGREGGREDRPGGEPSAGDQSI